ncbi:MAG: ABC transporter substrate-binding protein [Candidatus Bathyarchaeia archaeon]
MNSKKVALMFVLSLVLFASLMVHSSPRKVALAAEVQKGPRAPEFQMILKATTEAAYASLVAGELEYIGGLLPAQFEDAQRRPEITTYLELIYSMQDEAIMSNYSMPSQKSHPNAPPGSSGILRSPTNDVNFRKAVNHLFNKDWICETVWKGLVERIDVPIAAPSKGWMNTSCFNLYPFSFEQAIAKLTDPAVYGSAQNGWYDYDGDGIRNYPLDWPGVQGQPGVRDEPNMLPLQYWIYDDPPQRYEFAHNVAENLRSIGIPVDEHVAPFQLINDQCFCAYDYHLSSDGWAVGRFPTYIQFFFDSELWIPGYCGANCYTGGNEPWTAEIDEAVRAVRYAATPEDSRVACLYAQWLLVDKWAVGMIPLYTPKAAYAVRNVLGAVKFFGASPFNELAMMNMFRIDDPNAPIRMGFDFPPNVNTIYCMWAVGYTIMQMTWEFPMQLNPLDPMYEMPWGAIDWDVGTWVDPADGKTKTVTKWWFRPGTKYIAPVTGEPLDDFTAASNIFGMWYVYQTTDAWWWSDFRDLHHIRVDPTNPYYFEIYFNRFSCWFYLDTPYSTNLGIYPPAYKVYPLCDNPDHTYTSGQPVDPIVRVFVEGENMSTPGDLALPWQTKYAPVEIVSIVQQGVGPLKPSDTTGNYDYEMVKGKIHIYKDLPNGAVITVTYYGRGEAYGTTPGDIPWDKIFIGAGKWYMTYLDLLAGAYFKANRNYWAETPPLGETDWYYWRIEGPKPRKGYFQINIYDVVVATGAYGTQGRYTPDPAFTVSADLAPSADGLGGKIDIYDVVTITGSYGTKFWEIK